MVAWLFFPFIFAVVGLYVFARPGTANPQLVYGSWAAGLIGFCGVAYLDGGLSIQDERWNGTLEQVFAVPTPLWVILLGTFAAASSGGCCHSSQSCCRVLWLSRGRCRTSTAAGSQPRSPSVTFIDLAIAVALAPLYALWRWALPVLNGFEFGFCILCGFMFPVTLLAGGTGAAGVLAPTWATRAMYASTTNGGPHDFGAWWLAAVGLQHPGTIVGAFFLYRLVDRRARMSGELALA